jgi:D-alanyl-D-alanine carboxypeptidase
LSRKRLLLIILLPASILGAVWLVGVAVRGGSQDRDGLHGSEAGPGGQGSRSSAAAQAPNPAERASRLIGDLQDLIDRHPDYDLAEARRALQELQGLQGRPAGPRTQILAELEARVTALEANLRAEATGLRPNMEGWNETLRFKSFSPNGFRDFYERMSAPHAAVAAAAPSITGESAADRRIAELAIARGYRLRAQADEGRLEREGRHALQPEAFAAWRALQAAARGDGIELEIVSAYRSVERQREIFLRTLEQAGIARQGSVRSGRADGLVEAVLRESSPPGFSKHHHGYTIDITDAASGLEFTDFGRTAGFAWISRWNFLNAKRFGFLPSYPQGAGSQGPDPEPWEYVWVGTAVLVSHPDSAEPGSPARSEP